MPSKTDACSRLRDRRVRGDWESANRKVASLPLSESLEQAMIAWVRGCRLGWRPSLRTAIVKFSVYFAVCYCDLYIQWNLDLTKGLTNLFVITRFRYIEVPFFIYFTIAEEEKIVRYTEVFVTYRFVKSRFHCKITERKWWMSAF